MVFLIITLAVLAGGVFCTFKIANRFGLNLNIRSLLLCSLCALVINFFLPYVILQFSSYQLFFLFALIVTSAFFITQYNERINMRALANAGQVFAVNAPEVLERAEERAAVCEAAPPVPAAQPAPGEPAAQAKEAPPAPEAPAPGGGAPAARTEASASAAMAAPWFTLPKKSAGAAKPRKRVFPAAPTRLDEKRAGAQKPLRLPACVCPTVAERVASDMQNAKLLKLTAVLAKLGSLDALLDYAYAQKDLGAYENAIFAFKQALERYHGDAYAPFIVIELCNIYKKAGAYDEAIVIYKRAFQLPAICADAALKQEFERSLAYLYIVRETLMKYNCLKTPFGRIPAALLEEIENAFHNWRKKHAS